MPSRGIRPTTKKIRRFADGGGVDSSALSRDDIERRLKQQAITPVYPEALVGLGGALRAAGAGVTKAVDYFGRPAVKNVVVGPRSSHVYRNVSKRELNDIKDSGFARRDPTPEGAKRTWSDKSKWWSAGDDVAPAGRTWNKGDATVRTKADKVPSRRATRADDLEVYDVDAGRFVDLSKATRPGRFTPDRAGKVEFKQGGKVSASKRGDGIAKRGKTRGKVF